MANQSANQQPNNPPPNFSDQEQHYKSLIELFKYSVTFAGILFTVIAFVVGFITFKDGQEMRNSEEKARQEIRDNLKEMRTEIREERDRMEQKSAQSKAELSDKEKELMATVSNLIQSTNRDINATRVDAIHQISGVKNEATTAARIEAKNRINEVFKEKNLEPFIETVAKDRLEPKVKQFVDKQFKDFDNNLVGQINDAQLLSQVSNGLMNTQNGYHVIMLDSLYRFSKNANIRASAGSELEFYKNVDTTGNAKYYKLTGDSLTYDYFKSYIPKLAKRPLPDHATIVKVIYSYMKDVNSNYRGIEMGFALFNRLTGQDIITFDYAELDKAYADYKTRRYPLKMGKR